MTSFIVCPLPKTFGRITFFFSLSSRSDIVGKFRYVGKQTASSLAQRNFKLLMCFFENME